MTETDRNLPCPCGSGKKFKKCCLLKEEAVNSSEHGWDNIRHTEGELARKHLMPFVDAHCPEFVKMGWNDFIMGNKRWPTKVTQILFDTMFIAWFLYDWKPYTFTAQQQRKEDLPLALQYLEKKHHKLTDYQRHFIKAMCQTYYSFYTVIDITPEQNITVKDILLNTIVTVKERLATRFLQCGDLIFARILALDEQVIFVGMPPFHLPTELHLEILDNCERVIQQHSVLTPHLLRHELADDLRMEYWSILENLL